VVTVTYALVQHEVTAHIAGCLHAQGVGISLGGPLGLAHLALTGSARQASVTAASARVADLTVHDLNAAARDVHVSPWALLTGHATATAGSVTAQATVTQADLNSAVHARGLPLQIRVDRSGITIQGGAAGVVVASVQAALKTSNHGRDVAIKITPSLMPQLFGLRVPGLVTMATLPAGVSIDGLALRPGAIVVTLHSAKRVRLSVCPV
jgi:DUF2993 family protein